MPVDGDRERIFATEVTPTHRRRGLAGLSRAIYLRSAIWERTELQAQGAERRCTRKVARQAGLHMRIAFVLLFLAMSGMAAAQPTSSSHPSSPVPADYASQILNPEWRAAFPYRAAFGSLCSLGPLACALIDRPFALNARLELMIRPKAPDGSTGVLLPFAVSVPLFGRAEVGLGSCYAGFWATKDEAGKANDDPTTRRPSGLCPFFLAGKLLLFPWFRDPHRHPALAMEYLFDPLRPLRSLRLYMPRPHLRKPPGLESSCQRSIPDAPPAPMAAAALQPTQTSSKPAPRHAPRQDRFERVTEEAQSVPGSAFASGFVDGAKDSYIHARDPGQISSTHSGAGDGAHSR